MKFHLKTIASMIPRDVDNVQGDGRLLQVKSEEDHRELVLSECSAERTTRSI